jgi:hypothetical protein
MKTNESPAVTTAAASNFIKRPLEDLGVGISISVGEESMQHGYSEEEVNRSVVRLSDALLSRGARLVFGHDWRPSGIMSAVARLAVAYEPSRTLDDHHQGRRPCRITNLVPSDKRLELSPDLRTELESRGLLRIEEVPIPSEIGQCRGVDGAALRAARLRVLRKSLADLCEARICLGGKLEKFEGFCPGILEEALLSASKVPDGKVLLSGLFGGAAAKVLEAAHSKEWGELGKVNPELLKGYEQLNKVDPVTFPEISLIPELLSWDRLQQRSGLSPEDFDRLAGATDIEVVATLAIKALSKREVARS